MIKIGMDKAVKHRKTIALFTAIMFFAGFVLWDAAATDRALASGADVKEIPHVIKAGDTELAVLSSYNDADLAVEMIKSAYGEDDSSDEAIVSPTLKIELKESAIGEKDPKTVSAKEAASAIIEKNNKENIFTVAVTISGVSTLQVPYEVETVEDENLDEGETKTVQEGQNGEKVIIGDTILVNGEYKNTASVETKIIKEPVNKVVHKGVKKEDEGAGDDGGNNKSSNDDSKGVVTGAFTWPIPSSRYIVSNYGGRVGPIYGNEFHMGIDIAGSYGVPIVAADGGKVVEAGWHSSYGYQVVIQHGNGLKTRYAHNSSLNVSVGQRVSKGQTIALCGSTGDSVAPHLHFEVWLNGSHTNPLNYL